MRGRVLGLMLVMAVLSACGDVTPRVTPTVAPTLTPQETLISQNPTNTPIVRSSSTATVSATPSETQTPTIVFSDTATVTATQTDTATLVPTATDTATGTPLPTDTATNTATATHTATITPTFTATPTDTATFTPSPTHTGTPIPTDTPTNTATFTATPTDTATLTPSATATGTPIPTDTATHTATFTATNSETPTLTATNTVTATNTELPTLTPFISPTFTATVTPSETPTATNTPLPTITPTETFTPSVTPTPTIDATRNMELLLTRQALQTPTPEPTWTALPLATATSTLVPPTQDITPTQVTATLGADDFGIITTPIPSSPTVDVNAPTATFTATLTLVPTQVVVTVAPTPIPPPSFGRGLFYSNAQSLTFSGLTFNPFTGVAFTNGGDARLFAQNTVYPESYARVDSFGMLSFAPPGGGEGVMTFSPFYEGFTAPSAAENKNRVVEIEWSPNGQYLAFVVYPPEGTDTAAAGVWFWQPDRSMPTDPTYTLMHDCPASFYISCTFTGSSVGIWRTINIEWSPASNYILSTVFLPNAGRQGIAVVAAVRDAEYRKNPVNIWLYDHGSWLPDGRILVSGRRPDGLVIVGIVTPINGGKELVDEQILLNASANNLWVEAAAMRPDGNIVALARDASSGGAVYLALIANGTATPISSFIGGNAPQRIEWSQGNRTVIVQVDGVQYIVDATNGSITQAITSP